MANLISSGGVFCVFLTKPFVKKFAKPGANVKTNAYSIIGKNAIVTKEIDSNANVGQIRVGGDVWSAKTENEEVIPAHAEVKVLRIEGVKAIVTTDLTAKPDTIEESV